MAAPPTPQARSRGSATSTRGAWAGGRSGRLGFAGGKLRDTTVQQSPIPFEIQVTRGCGGRELRGFDKRYDLVTRKSRGAEKAKGKVSRRSALPPDKDALRAHRATAGRRHGDAAALPIFRHFTARLGRDKSTQLHRGARWSYALPRAENFVT